MVWDPPKIPVNVRRMIIYSFIPILGIYAGWRIQKFWVLFGINIVLGFGISILLAVVLPYPLNSLVSWGIEIPVSIFMVQHFARAYNAKVSSTDTQIF